MGGGEAAPSPSGAASPPPMVRNRTAGRMYLRKHGVAREARAATKETMRARARVAMAAAHIQYLRRKDCGGCGCPSCPSLLPSADEAAARAAAAAAGGRKAAS
eukprot:1802329-Prymnesium_polylepis.1